MRTEEPRAIHLKDYRAPDYRISEIALDFLLEPETTRVTAVSKMTRTGSGPLVLNGEQLKLVSVEVNGKAHPHEAGDETLTLANLPDAFTLKIVTEISPANNTALEGLYVASGIFCTQC